jgi:hypothetical protein
MFRDEQRVIRAVELDGLPERRLDDLRVADNRDRHAVDFIQTLELPHLRAGVWPKKADRIDLLLRRKVPANIVRMSAPL